MDVHVCVRVSAQNNNRTTVELYNIQGADDA